MARRTWSTHSRRAATALAVVAATSSAMATTTSAPEITPAPSAVAIGDIHTVFLGRENPSSDQVLVASIVSQDTSMTEYLVRCDPFAGVFTMDRYDDHIAAVPTSSWQSEMAENGDRVKGEGQEPAQVLGHRQQHHHHQHAGGEEVAARCESTGLTWVTMWPSEGRYQWTVEDSESHRRQKTCVAEKTRNQKEAHREEEEVTLAISCTWQEIGLEATADGSSGSNVETYTLPTALLTSKFFATVSVTGVPTADSDEVGELKKRASSASNCPSPPPSTPAAVTGGSPVSDGSGGSESSPTSGSAAPTRSPNVGRTVAIPTTDGPGMVVAAAAVGVGAFVFGWGLL